MTNLNEILDLSSHLLEQFYGYAKNSTEPNLIKIPEYNEFKNQIVDSLMEKVNQQSTLQRIGEMPKRLISRLITIDSKAMRDTKAQAVGKIADKTTNPGQAQPNKITAENWMDTSIGG